MARDAIQRLTELVSALERGACPSAEVSQWFTSAAASWMHSTDGRPIGAHLGISQRLRLHYIASRQRDYLEQAVEVFAASRPEQSDYALAGEFVMVIERTERARPIVDHGSTSALVRFLALALALPRPVPRSREYWRQAFARNANAILVCGQEAETAPQSPEVDSSMENATEERSRAELETEWHASADLQQEFATVDQYVAYMGAHQRGLVKLFRRAPR